MSLVVLVVVTGCAGVTVGGRVTIKGTAPATYVALVVSRDSEEPGDGEGEAEREGEYAVVGPLEEKIRSRHQGRYLIVRGRIVREASGPGFPAELEVTEILETRPAAPGDSAPLD